MKCVYLFVLKSEANSCPSNPTSPDNNNTCLLSMPPKHILGSAAAAITTLLSLASHLPTTTATGVPEGGVISNLADLHYDDNGHLASHLIVYPGTGPCASLITDQVYGGIPLYDHVPVAVDGEAAAAFFGEDDVPQEGEEVDISQCPAVCVDRGVDADLVGYPMPEKYYNPDDNNTHNSFAGFIGSLSCGRVEFGFINYSPHVLSLFWVDANTGEKSYLYPLEQKEKNTRFIHTFVGHRFVAEHPETGENFLDITVEFSGVVGVMNHVNVHRNRDIRAEVKRTMQGEWRKKQMVKRTFR